MKTSYSEKIKDYLQAVDAAHTHTGKLITFSELLKSVFGVSSYQIVPNVEQYVKSGGLMVLKGRLDMRLGQTIIEFKIDLAKELETAIEEIERYTTILRKNGQKVAACIVTDGTEFKVYTVREQSKEVRSINFEEVTPEQAIMFLDAFLFSGRKVPTAEDLNMRFGPGSPIYEEATAELSTLFDSIKDPIKFELWSRNMQLVYGSVPPREAFISQTYLMILVRVLLARHLVKGYPPALESLNGQLFDSQGIKIIEDDFFSWILTPIFWSEVKPFVDTITEALDTYDLENVDEDIFKEIYQEIIKKGERHRIGEYYTPEWLAELALCEAVGVLDPKNERKIVSILDPACGSGTFLTNSISFLRKKGCTLEQILDNVCGIDVNPIAVAISRANYLLALGELIEKRKEAVFVPVFMADSINLPIVRKELIYGTSILAIDVGDKSQLSLPLEIALDENKLKQVLTAFADILFEYKRQKLTKIQALRVFEKSHTYDIKSMAVIQTTLRNMMNLVDENKDSIWVFMLRNIYAPLRMRQRKFDLVIGNPPWISLRYIENPSYQDFLKKAVFEYGLLTHKETHLFTQMDTSTVFYVKAADNYLGKGGVLAFIMPRSVLTGAKQHIAFRKHRKPLMNLIKILDTEKVNPLFNVDSCTMIAKSGKATIYPVPSVLITGSLPEKNMRLNKAVKYLTIKKSEYFPQTVDEKRSPYYDKMQNGAGIYPRTLWFFKPVSSKFGSDPNRPFVESLILPDAKDPWDKVNLQGEIEKEFIFATMISKYLLPFKLEYLPVVLPIERGRRSWKVYTSEDLRKNGKFKVADWVDKVEDAWKKNATDKNLKSYAEAMDYVNYNNKLLDQRLDLRYYVVYTASGTHIAAVAVDTQKVPDFSLGSVQISPNGFVPDVTTFYFSTNNLGEVHYLSAILNSNILDEKIKRIQTRGKFGPRHIHRRPFEFFIPEFDRDNELHKKISAAGEKATKEATKLPKMSRLKIKAAIPSMKEIDKLVLKLLKR